MKKELTNTELFQKTAKKLGLKFKKTPVERNKGLFSISGNGQHYFGSPNAPGFYPNVTRWNGAFTVNKKLAQSTLTQLGYKTIPSKFLIPTAHASFKSFWEKAQKMSPLFPIIIKPNAGFHGRGIQYVTDSPQLKRALQLLYREGREFMLQPVIDQEEYRILIVNGKVELVSSRSAPSVQGDGTKTIDELLATIPEDSKNTDFIRNQYAKNKLTPKTILEESMLFPYHILKDTDCRYYQSEKLPKELVKWANTLSKTLSAPVIGMDLFVNGQLSDPDNYTVIELNSNPGLANYYNKCGDSSQPLRICEKVLRDYFKI
ncbi:MAG: hypothetical protein ACI9VM_000474 [Candidatus Azotimanducaceae bacterium]|jgi:hypothetical protein